MRDILHSFLGKLILSSLIVGIVFLGGCSEVSDELADYVEDSIEYQVATLISEAPISSASANILETLPAYSGSPYTTVNNNIPQFSEEDLTTASYEYYGPLDPLGRCTVAIANVGEDLMPTEDRERISQVKPTGWQSARYDWIDGESLYNRCHLIAFQLTGENANENNLITGTRYMNTEGMIPFEHMVGDYVRETGNHVLYRVTPIFEGNNLIAAGVQMEGMSVEDGGEGVLFNVFAYNVQPGIGIDYATGDNWVDDSNTGYNSEEWAYGNSSASGEASDYILNTNSRKFHEPDCDGITDISEYNRKSFTGSREQLIDGGYEPCGRCNP